MGLLLTLLLFIVLMGVVTVLGMKFYVRPKEAIERVAGVATEHREQIASHPSLAFRDLLQRLGDVLPASPKDVTVMQRRLIRAGLRGPHALKLLYGSKMALLVLLPVLTTAYIAGADMASENKIMAVLAAAAAPVQRRRGPMRCTSTTRPLILRTAISYWRLPRHPR